MPRPPPSPFPDSLPSELDPLTESDWSKLDEATRSKYLRAHAEQLWLRHVELRDSLTDLGQHVTRHGELLADQATALRINTELTESASKKLDTLLDRVEGPLRFAEDVAGTGRIVGRIGSIVKDLGWIVVPLGALWIAAEPALKLLRSYRWFWQ